MPLQLAYERGHKDVVNYLAKKAADVDPILINKVLFNEQYNYNMFQLTPTAAVIEFLLLCSVCSKG